MFTGHQNTRLSSNNKKKYIRKQNTTKSDEVKALPRFLLHMKSDALDSLQ